MIDDMSPDGLGWARFSDHRTQRYRLGRRLTPRALDYAWTSMAKSPLVRVVFVMLNPSTADAFKVDPTIARCCEFARRWGADVLEVVNLFALRSTDPKGLAALAHGADSVNDAQILDACARVPRVIGAWGNHGTRFGRAVSVYQMLAVGGVPVFHLGVTNDGHPKHPLARGKHFIPYETEPALLSSYDLHKESL